MEWSSQVAGWWVARRADWPPWWGGARTAPTPNTPGCRDGCYSGPSCRFETICRSAEQLPHHLVRRPFSHHSHHCPGWEARCGFDLLRWESCRWGALLESPTWCCLWSLASASDVNTRCPTTNNVYINSRLMKLKTIAKVKGSVGRQSKFMWEEKWGYVGWTWGCNETASYRGSWDPQRTTSSETARSHTSGPSYRPGCVLTQSLLTALNTSQRLLIDQQGYSTRASYLWYLRVVMEWVIKVSKEGYDSLQSYLDDKISHFHPYHGHMPAQCRGSVKNDWFSFFYLDVLYLSYKLDVVPEARSLASLST